MDYKQKYEQALERCKEEFNFNNLAYSHDEIKQKLKRVFPELKESEVEPKFNVGDWVVYCNEDVDLITGVGETGYIINKGGGYIPFVCEDEMRLWTIEDAKDGDVLTDGKPFIFKSINVNKHSYAYCGLSVDNAFIIESEGEYGEWTWIQDIKPASKEQRELLFQKMKEAGYEWDSKKKELKLI